MNADKRKSIRIVFRRAVGKKSDRVTPKAEPKRVPQSVNGGSDQRLSPRGVGAYSTGEHWPVCPTLSSSPHVFQDSQFRGTVIIQLSSGNPFWQFFNDPIPTFFQVQRCWSCTSPAQINDCLLLSATSTYSTHALLRHPNHLP